MTSPYISLIFVNYRSVYQLSLALRSLFLLEKEQNSYEIIVINNDLLEERALQRLAQKLGFSLSTLSSNVGFGVAANRGATLARGTILGFLNPDTVWQKSSLSEIKVSFQTGERDCLLGMTLFDKRGRADHLSGGSTPRMSQLFLENLFPFRQAARFSSPDWVSGGALFLRKKTFDDLGGFDERFFLYFEDVDLCLRAHKQGVTVVREPRLGLLHEGGKSFSSRTTQKKQFYLSQQRYYGKHRPAWEGALLRFLHFILHGI